MMNDKEAFVDEAELEEEDIEDAARELFMLFEAYSDNEEGAFLVTDIGLEKMSAFFETVAVDTRGWVFQSFLALLYEAGYGYDVQQFLNMDSVED